MIAEIDTHFILIKWKGSFQKDQDIQGYKIVSIEEYYKWKTSLLEEIGYVIVNILDWKPYNYTTGKGLLEDISCSILDRKEFEVLKGFTGMEFGETSFWNYQTEEEIVSQNIVSPLKSIDWKENKFLVEVKNYVKKAYEIKGG